MFHNELDLKQLRTLFSYIAGELKMLVGTKKADKTKFLNDLIIAYLFEIKQIMEKNPNVKSMDKESIPLDLVTLQKAKNFLEAFKWRNKLSGFDQVKDENDYTSSTALALEEAFILFITKIGAAGKVAKIPYEADEVRNIMDILTTINDPAIENDYLSIIANPDEEKLDDDKYSDVSSEEEYSELSSESGYSYDSDSTDMQQSDNENEGTLEISETPKEIKEKNLNEIKLLINTLKNTIETTEWKVKIGGVGCFFNGAMHILPTGVAQVYEICLRAEINKQYEVGLSELIPLKQRYETHELSFFRNNRTKKFYQYFVDRMEETLSELKPSSLPRPR